MNVCAKRAVSSGIIALGMLVALPATGQVRDTSANRSAPREQDQSWDQSDMPQGPASFSGTVPVNTGHMAKSAVGEVGQRLRLGQAMGIKPMARLESRIPNRIQNRLRTRIDRNFDPQSNATSSFTKAEARARDTISVAK